MKFGWAISDKTEQIVVRTFLITTILPSRSFGTFPLLLI
jgi:hypothetical protein